MEVGGEGGGSNCAKEPHGSSGMIDPTVSCRTCCDGTGLRAGDLKWSGLLSGESGTDRFGFGVEGMGFDWGDEFVGGGEVQEKRVFSTIGGLDGNAEDNEAPDSPAACPCVAAA